MSKRVWSLSQLSAERVEKLQKGPSCHSERSEARMILGGQLKGLSLP